MDGPHVERFFRGTARKSLRIRRSGEGNQKAVPRRQNGYLFFAPFQIILKAATRGRQQQFRCKSFKYVQQQRGQSPLSLIWIYFNLQELRRQLCDA